uniref:Uncharacterized protein n=1 Tax=Glossina austeni TaxID=7395 RepID=A0A1A9VNY5_GLOAU
MKHGVSACFYGCKNKALDQTKEYVNGQLKNKYGDTVVRSNNGLYAYTHKRQVCLREFLKTK